MIAKTLIIRADAFVKLGTGHVMRCLALAQAAKEKGAEISFVISPTSEAVIKKIESEGFKIIHQPYQPGSDKDAEHTIEKAHKTGSEWIVCDGYHFESPYQKKIKDSCLKLLFADDYGHCEHYYADIVLNQNIYADESLYPSKEDYTQILCGTKYALLRNEFRKYKPRRRDIPEKASKIIVTLGGSDPDNTTVKVIKALDSFNGKFEIKVIVGGSNPHYNEIKSEAEKFGENIEIILNASNMLELMEWADIAVSAAGSTCWEFCLTGLPMAVIAIADNQKPIAEAISKKKIGISLGNLETLDIGEMSSSIKELTENKPKREKLSFASQKAVDGLGAERVAEKILT